MEQRFIGWREWLALPELGVPAIKAKIDTGARTSALHTFVIEPYLDRGRSMVRFGVHPLQRRRDVELFCRAEVVDRRAVTSSNGQRETRYVIRTPMELAGRRWPVELTLTNRDTLNFRMLLGRTALQGVFIDPAASYLAGRALAKAYRPKRRRSEKEVR